MKSIEKRLGALESQKAGAKVVGIWREPHDLALLLESTVT